MLKTLVTGGAGFIGSAVVRGLAANKESVRVLSRRPVHIPVERRTPGVEYAAGDVFDEASLMRAMEGCDALVNAVQFDGAPFENPKKGRTYERVDGEGTERQVKAARSAGVKRIMYVSGAGTREGRREPWFRAKWRAEEAVRGSGIPWTIFRPSWVYGPGDRSLNRLASLARISPVIPLVGGGTQKIQPVFVEDLARAVTLSLNLTDTFGKTFEVGGPEELSLKEVVRRMLRAMGKRRLLLPLPKAAVKALAGILQHLPGRMLTPEAVDFITMEEKVARSDFLDTLGIRWNSYAGLRRVA